MPSSDQDGVYSVHYNSESHIGVILQKTGSVWPKVLPYCVLNGALALVLHLLKSYYDIDLGITDKGHSLMTLFVAFLIVSRVSMSLGRYNESRSHLGKMYREARELVQNMVVFTRADQSDAAKQWRHDLAYDISILLRMAMAVIDFPENHIPCWELPELQGKAKEFILLNLEMSKKVSHFGDRGVAENNMRAPIQMGYVVRDTIYTANKYLDQSSQIGAWQFGRLFGGIDSFMGGYYGIRKFVTTPFPFPLVQMARTFMFLYLFTLPFALLDAADHAWVHATVCFLVTFGFVGLETVSIELDNPFGDDENDFDNLGMAYTALEDTYVTIYAVDGEEWMEKLRRKLTPPNGRNGYPTESTSLV